MHGASKDAIKKGGIELKASLQELKESKKNLISSFSGGAILDIFPESYAEVIDQYFRSAFQESRVQDNLSREKDSFALVAVGGYGRKELCLHSDIDIMMLFNKKISHDAKGLAEEILFPLWDFGFDLGYGIRSIKDCLTLAQKDFKVLTSIMDSRFICGDFTLYDKLADSIQKKIINKKAPDFKRWLDEQDLIRMDTFGDASYLLEPNLKEGIGGLRDYHNILWLSRFFLKLSAPGNLSQQSILTHDEHRELEKRLRFIRLIRNFLHHLSRRKNDRLGLEYQERIAHWLGFKDRKNILAVEQFMGKLHSDMAAVKSLYRSFVLSNFSKKKKRGGVLSAIIPKNFRVNNGEIYFLPDISLASDPFLIMEIFALSSNLACPLSREARGMIRESLYLADDEFRNSKKSAESFYKIINKSEYTFETLDQMMETGFLDAFIPEFGKIKDHVQFDTYHIYPMGRHSLQTVRYLKGIALEDDLLLRDIFRAVGCPERLFLAGLFHDIGKFGKDHAVKGSKIVRKILKRLDFDDEGIEEVSRLVKYHLFLVETATRRDLNDEKLVIQCARQIGTPNFLRMLYLLTWADSRATGPKAWNEWIANLVQELFFKILHILEKGDLAAPDTSRKVERVKSEVRKKIDSGINRDTLDVYLEAMSPRYLLNTSSRDIVRHLEMIYCLKNEKADYNSGGRKKSSPDNFWFEAKNEGTEGFWEITILSRDSPGLFSKISGVLAINNINILSAEIYTWRDGMAVDIFRVTNPPDTVLIDKVWKKVEEDLRNSLTGRISLEYRLGLKASPSIISDIVKSLRPPEVIIDNEGSDFFTIIEVFADDRVGLLFEVTRTLFDFQLDVHIARISTKVDQVADIFYVRDLEGQKVEDEEHIKEIKRALRFHLENKAFADHKMPDPSSRALSSNNL